MSTITIAYDGNRYFLTADGFTSLRLPDSIIPYLERDEVLRPVYEEVSGWPISNSTLHAIRQMLVQAAVNAGAGISYNGPRTSSATESLITQLGD